MQDKTREKILREAGEQIKAMLKELLERLGREERALYLEEHPTKATGTTPATSHPHGLCRGP